MFVNKNVNGFFRATSLLKIRKVSRFVSGISIVVIIVVDLFLGSEYMSNHFEKGFRVGQRVPLVNGTQNKTRCTPEMRKHMLKKPLPITIDNNVDIHEYEMSGCFEIDADAKGINRIINERKRTQCEPIEKRFLNNTGTVQFTALLSIPGSGNHWVRHLLEEITGVYTGSVYGYNHIDQVFKGEHTIHNVIAVKTHTLTKGNFSRAIIIVRDPFDSTLAETNRRQGNETISIQQSQFNVTEFNVFLNNQIRRCVNAKSINSFKGDLFILYYDKLITDLANSLTKVAAFLHSEVSLERLLCTVNNKDGLFKRTGKPEFMSRKYFVDETMEKRILEWKEANHNALMNRTSPWASN